MGPCPPSPAAALPMLPTSAGTSITVTCAWARSRYAPACHPVKTRGLVLRLLTAATLDRARADFEKAWRVFLSNRREADFQAWRDQRDWTARKYAMWERGETDADAETWFADAVPLRRDFQQPPHRTHPDPRSACNSRSSGRWDSTLK